MKLSIIAATMAYTVSPIVPNQDGSITANVNFGWVAQHDAVEASPATETTPAVEARPARTEFVMVGGIGHHIPTDEAAAIFAAEAVAGVPLYEQFSTQVAAHLKAKGLIPPQ